MLFPRFPYSVYRPQKRTFRPNAPATHPRLLLSRAMHAERWRIYKGSDFERISHHSLPPLSFSLPASLRSQRANHFTAGMLLRFHAKSREYLRSVARRARKRDIDCRLRDNSSVLSAGYVVRCASARIYHAQAVLSAIRENLREGVKQTRSKGDSGREFCAECSAPDNARSNTSNASPLLPLGIKDSNQFSRWDISAALVRRDDPRVYSVARKFIH